MQQKLLERKLGGIQSNDVFCSGSVSFVYSLSELGSLCALCDTDFCRSTVRSDRANGTVRSATKAGRPSTLSALTVPYGNASHAECAKPFRLLSNWSITWGRSGFSCTTTRHPYRFSTTDVKKVVRLRSDASRDETLSVSTLLFPFIESSVSCKRHRAASRSFRLRSTFSDRGLSKAKAQAPDTFYL